MNALIEKYARKLDALTQRERLMVFAAAAALVLFIAYQLAIGPLLDRRNQMAALVADQKAQITAAAAQKVELQRALKQDPDSALRERVAAKRRQIAQIDDQLSRLQRSLIPPEKMGAVLEQLVGKDRRVRIVQLRNLPPAPLVQKEGGQASSAAPDARTPATSESVTLANSHVYKHGVRVVVEGTYLDLLSYVARLEKQPWQVYWSRTVMSADYPKAQIELTLYTLSLDRAWLVV